MNQATGWSKESAYLYPSWAGGGGIFFSNAWWAQGYSWDLFMELWEPRWAGSAHFCILIFPWMILSHSYPGVWGLCSTHNMTKFSLHSHESCTWYIPMPNNRPPGIPQTVCIFQLTSGVYMSKKPIRDLWRGALNFCQRLQFTNREIAETCDSNGRYGRIAKVTLWRVSRVFRWLEVSLKCSSLSFKMVDTCHQDPTWWMWTSE